MQITTQIKTMATTEAKSGALKSYKSTPTSQWNALNAAHHAARRDDVAMVVFQSVNNMTRIWTVAATTADLAYYFGFSTTVPCFVVHPNGSIDQSTAC